MTGRYLQLEHAQLEQLLSQPDLAEAVAFPEQDPQPDSELDIDKSWDMIDFLLRRVESVESSALVQAVIGGQELEGTDTGYGPFRVLNPAEVSAVSEALSSLPGEELWKRFDAQAAQAADVYPEGWSGAEHERLYVLGHYAALQSFFRLASSRRRGLLAYLA